MTTPRTALGRRALGCITPTPPGEGKTTTSIGLSDGLNFLGEKSIVVIREPSLGPVFGISNMFFFEFV